MELNGNAMHKHCIESRKHPSENIATVVIPPVKKSWSILTVDKKNDHNWQQLTQELFKLRLKEWNESGTGLTDFCNIITEWDRSNNNLSADSRRVVRMNTSSFVKDNFCIDNNVNIFLKENDFLTILLTEIHTEILKYFSEPKLYLEVVGDPESAENSQLLLSVASCLEPDVAIAKLYEFDKNWWLNNILRAKDKLCIDVMML